MRHICVFKQNMKHNHVLLLFLKTILSGASTDFFHKMQYATTLNKQKTHTPNCQHKLFFVTAQQITFSMSKIVSVGVSS